MNIEEYIRVLLEWIAGQEPYWVWIFFFFSNLTENVFPPWPGDTVTVFGGFLVAQKSLFSLRFGWIGLITSTLAGNLAGGYLMFRFGGFLLKWVETHDFPFKKRLFSQEDLESTLKWFSKRKVLVVIFSRFSAGIRFFVSIVAGMAEMPLWQFVMYFTIAVCLWCGLLIGGGFYLGQNWEFVLQVVSIYNKIIFGVIIGIILVIFFFRMER